jgi:hypothetical protein
LLLVFSHGTCMLVCFYVGASLLTQRVNVNMKIVDDFCFDASAEQFRSPKQTLPAREELPRFDQQSIGAMARIDHSFFAQSFDSGIPAVASNKQQQVLVLYDSTSAELMKKTANSTRTTENPLAATNACQQVRVAYLQQHAAGTCLALDTGNTLEPHHYMYKWVQQQRKKRLYRMVSRFSDQTLQYSPPKPIVTNEAAQTLLVYLQHLQEYTRALRPLARKVAFEQTNENNNTSGNSTKQVVVALVCTRGHIALLTNMVCASRAVGVITKVLVFAMDEATHEHAQALGVTSFYAPALASTAALAEGSYGTIAYARIVLAKVQAVHLLVNQLGYDVVYQDVDVIPLRADYVDFFLNLVATNYATSDFVMQYDPTTVRTYAPWMANTGWYFIRSTKRSRYVMSRMLRSFDMILQTKSHQATMSVVMMQVASQHGLNVTVLVKEQTRFAAGYHFHHDSAYMKRMFAKQVKPVLFHMNWNQNAPTKIQFLQQVGLWFVSDNSNNDTLTCAQQPIPVCHYQDKPSLLRDCSMSPFLETNVSFW